MYRKVGLKDCYNRCIALEATMLNNEIEFFPFLSLPSLSSLSLKLCKLQSLSVHLLLSPYYLVAHHSSSISSLCYKSLKKFHNYLYLVSLSGTPNTQIISINYNLQPGSAYHIALFIYLNEPPTSSVLDNPIRKLNQ